MDFLTKFHSKNIYFYIHYIYMLLQKLWCLMIYSIKFRFDERNRRFTHNTLRLWSKSSGYLYKSTIRAVIGKRVERTRFVVFHWSPLKVHFETCSRIGFTANGNTEEIQTTCATCILNKCALAYWISRGKKHTQMHQNPIFKKWKCPLNLDF